MYTTNIIESVHRQFRKLTKTKGAFPNENSLLKVLYMGIMNVHKKWTMPIHNWKSILSELAILFEKRLENVENLTKATFEQTAANSEVLTEINMKLDKKIEDYDKKIAELNQKSQEAKLDIQLLKRAVVNL